MTRRVGWLLLAGAVLALLRSLMWSAEPRVLVVAPGDSVETALLLDQGLRAGWVRTDPVIRGRLVENLRFAGMDGTEGELVDQAITLGMDRTDPVVRARILDRARRQLESVGAPDDDQLTTYLSDHPERFERPALYVLEQHFRGAEGGEERPLPGLPSELRMPSDQLATRLGADFLVQLEALEVGQSGALRSVYGLHEVRVVERRPPRVPELAEIRAEVAAAWSRDRQAEVGALRLAQLRAMYRVEEP